MIATKIRSGMILETRRTGMQSKPARCGYVYVVAMLDYIKIGISRNPNARFRNIQCPAPLRVVFIDKFNSCREVESEAKRVADPHHTNGEWFSAQCSETVVEFLKSHANRHTKVTAATGPDSQQEPENIPENIPEILVPAFLRPDDAAAFCGVSRRWLAKLVAAGQLPVIRPSKRLTLFARADLEAALMKFRRGKI